MFLEYLKENPILTAVLAASLAVIFIVIVAMVVKNAKAKKNASDAASADETNDTNALSSASALRSRARSYRNATDCSRQETCAEELPRRANGETLPKRKRAKRPPSGSRGAPRTDESDDKSESGENGPAAEKRRQFAAAALNRRR
ncbi:MAG: hypothetical protein ACLRSW_17675 [Christensenellaceae bacterium]